MRYFSALSPRCDEVIQGSVWSYRQNFCGGIFGSCGNCLRLIVAIYTLNILLIFEPCHSEHFEKTGAVITPTAVSADISAISDLVEGGATDFEIAGDYLVLKYPGSVSRFGKAEVYRSETMAHAWTYDKPFNKLVVSEGATPVFEFVTSHGVSARDYAIDVLDTNGNVIFEMDSVYPLPFPAPNGGYYYNEFNEVSPISLSLWGPSGVKVPLETKGRTVWKAHPVNDSLFMYFSSSQIQIINGQSGKLISSFAMPECLMGEWANSHFFQVSRRAVEGMFMFCFACNGFVKAPGEFSWLHGGFRPITAVSFNEDGSTIAVCQLRDPTVEIQLVDSKTGDSLDLLAINVPEFGDGKRLEVLSRHLIWQGSTISVICRSRYANSPEPGSWLTLTLSLDPESRRFDRNVELHEGMRLQLHNSRTVLYKRSAEDPVVVGEAPSE